MKKIISILIVLAVLLTVLPGCSSCSKPASSTTIPVPGPVPEPVEPTPEPEPVEPVVEPEPVPKPEPEPVKPEPVEPAPEPEPIPAPIAGFTYEGGYAGKEIQFTSKSRNASAWRWNFGDGTPEVREENPSHVYQFPGIYGVELFVANPTGGDKQIQKILVLEKNGICLLDMEVKLVTVPAPVEGDTWRGYLGFIPFLADEGTEVMTPYIKWADEPRSSPNPAIFRSWPIRSIEYGSPGRLTVFAKLKKGVTFHVTCYVEYRDAAGMVKKSNEVTAELYIDE